MTTTVGVDTHRLQQAGLAGPGRPDRHRGHRVVLVVVADQTASVGASSTSYASNAAPTSVPFGCSDEGLPLGVQFAAELGGEGLLLALAGQLEQAAPWPRTAPEPV